jgi:hypothetical protein
MEQGEAATMECAPTQCKLPDSPDSTATNISRLQTLQEQQQHLEQKHPADDEDCNAMQSSYAGQQVQCSNQAAARVSKTTLVRTPAQKRPRSKLDEVLLQQELALVSDCQL